MSYNEKQDDLGAAYLGAVIAGGIETALEQGILADDFVNPDYQSVYRICQSSYHQYGAVDRHFIVDNLRAEGIVEVLDEIIAASQTVVGQKTWGEKLLNRRRRRKLTAGISSAAAALRDNEDTDRVLGDLNLVIAEALSQAATKLNLTNLEVYKTAFDEVKAMVEGRGGAMPTGIAPLDAKIAGLFPGELYIIAARPKKGKTALMANILANIAGNGTPVGAISLEMSNSELFMRMICRKMGWDWAEKRANPARIDLAKLADRGKAFADQPIYYDYAITAGELYGAMRRHAARGCKLVVLDYLQLMNGAGGKRHEEIAQITRTLKLEARANGMAVVALAQLNRTAEDHKRPSIHHLKGSGAIEQDMDMGLLLSQNQEEERDSDVCVEIVARKVPPGMVWLHFDKGLQEFNGNTTKRDDLSGRKEDIDDRKDWYKDEPY
ncbi:MAG: AAA family ATPase [Chloroflexi bacterium]|nr:AAA family ATPase [Chloroflexota bacterium]